jgi:hypothetical protein
MSLFDAPTPKPVELKASTTQTAPQYLTDYLTQLATTGQQQLGQTGDQLIAGLPQNLTDLYANAPTELARYQAPLDQSLQTLTGASTGVSAADIAAFNDPYQQNVIDEMTRQSALNTQRNLLPALRGAFAGSGGFGSQRYVGATGQALSDVQSDLMGQQAKFSSEGYKSALEAALRDRGYDISAGQALSGLGQAEAQGATTGLKALGDIGTQELGYGQSKIEAPLTRAQNVAQILRGYTYPTTTTDTKEALPSSYAPSALQQIAGLGTLVGSAFGKTINPKTGELVNTGAGYQGVQLAKDLYEGIKGYFPSGPTDGLEQLAGPTEAGDIP